VKNMEEVFKVTAASVACLDNNGRWLAAVFGGGPGWAGPMAEAATVSAAAGASIRDWCESLSQQAGCVVRY